MSAFDFDVVTGPSHPPARSSQEADRDRPPAPAATDRKDAPPPSPEDAARS